MDPATYRFAFWSLLILSGAVAVILYQHAQHTGSILTLLMPQSGPNAPQPITNAPGNIYGAASRASGLWTPLGPSPTRSVFPYNPPQTLQ